MRHLLKLAGLPLALALTTASVSSAAPIIFQRILPTLNLNGLPLVNTNRSNAGPIQQNYPNSILGDDFYITGTGSYVIDSISVFAISNSLAGKPSTEMASIVLYGGNDVSLATLSTVTGVAQIAGVESQVQYTGGLNYQSLYSPSLFSIYKLTFSGLNWTVSAGQFYDFAVRGNPIVASGNTFSLHTSNAGLSTPGGSNEDFPDDQFIFFNLGLPSHALLGGSTPGSIIDFNKGSDMNIIITGVAAIPEPSTIGMLAFGFGALVLKLRRK